MLDNSKHGNGPGAVEMEVEVMEEEEEQKQIGQLEPESWQQEMRLQCPKAVLECHKLR